jgi:mRNA interferase MazF
VTRTIRDIPTEVLLGPEDGLPAPCVASLDDITTIPKSLLGRRLVELPPSRMAEIEAAIRFALDLA